MKKTNFFAVERMKSLLLACLLLLSLFPGLALPAEAASSDKVLPEMSKFFETEYTQAKMTDYSRLLTCTYDKREGYEPLHAFLDLLQESRYQLKLDSISEPYPDSYSTATVQDYFFHYTGTSSAIKWIKLKNGTKYQSGFLCIPMRKRIIQPLSTTAIPTSCTGMPASLMRKSGSSRLQLPPNPRKQRRQPSPTLRTARRI